jgi:pyridinium-3,5-biscarboxylic acid mononucleotide synthase
LYNAIALDQERLHALLDAVAAGRVSADEAADRLANLPWQDLGFARVDHHRPLRGLGPETVFGRGKTPEQVVRIGEALLAEDGAPVLVTKAGQEHADAVLATIPDAAWHPRSGMLVLRSVPVTPDAGSVLVTCAGTSDLPVAEEAAVTAKAFGVNVDVIADVGVAGVHRVLAETNRLRAADVLVVVAGMEGALPSLVAGLVRAPVIAVPTSIGYGAAFDGLAALLGMLNACAVGVAVVNIDNGFGAGALAARMLAIGRKDASRDAEASR